MATQSSFSLPPGVDSDEVAAVLYSPFRSKDVNPSSWKRKMMFWQNFLEQIAKENRLITIDLSHLPQLLLRKGLTPKCLPTVIDELQRLGKVTSLEDYKKVNSWVSWGFNTLVKAPLSWGVSQILGSPKKASTIFVWPEVLQTVSEEFLLHLQSNISQEIMKPVISYSKLEALSSDIISTKEHFDLVVHHLQSEKKIHLEETEQHGLLVKVCERQRNSVSPIKTTDIQMFEIHEVYLHIKKELNILCDKIEKLKCEAREFLKNSQKRMALHCLKKKKLLEKARTSKSATLFNLEEILMKIEEAESNLMVVQACEAGVTVLKSLNRQVNIDKVESVMQEVQEAVDDTEEISSVIQSVGSGSDGMSDALMEEELAALLEEDQENQRQEALTSADSLLPDFTGLSISDSDFPQVPDHSPSSSKASLSKNEERGSFKPKEAGLLPS